MELKDLGIAGFLVQSVNILGNYGLKLALLFKVSQSLVSLVWLCIQINQILFIVVKKSLCLSVKECAGKDFFRRKSIFLLGMVKALFRAKIRDVGLCGNACASEENNRL